jgi:uncharacterized repeat protein (TIGR01451 family)
MKKTLLVILALVMALTLVIDSLSTASVEANVEKNNGAYVTIRGIPVTGDIEFDYGWDESKHFASPAVGYWLGLYDVTNSHYEWAGDNPFAALVGSSSTIVWNSLKLSLADTTVLSPGEYKIVFFVRGSYGPPEVTNVAAIETFFSIPHIALVKKGTLDMTVVLPKDKADVGDKINYTFTVTNIGDVTLTNVTVSDVPPLTTGPVPASVASLLPGATATFSGNYTLTKDDIKAGKVKDIATATATTPSGNQVTGKDSVTVFLRKDKD